MLQDLGNYNIQPPSFLFNKIKQRIDNDDDALFKKMFNGLAQYEAKPPKSYDERIDQFFFSAPELNDFKAFKNYEVKPPVPFSKILIGIKTMQASIPAKVIRIQLHLLVKRITVVAAVLLIGFFIYPIVKKSPVSIRKHPGLVLWAPPDKTKDKKAEPADTLMVKSKPDIVILKYPKYKRADLSVKAKPQEPQLLNTSFFIEGEKFTIVDNDLLVTFASFNQTNAPNFLLNDKQPVPPITVGDYASITISENMAGFFRKLYKAKKNGNPTRRSKKFRLKLEGWKKADEAYFNDSHNPLDPIELGQFILRK